MKKANFPYAKVNFLLSVVGFVGSLSFYYGVLHKVYSDEDSQQKQRIEELQNENKRLRLELDNSHFNSQDSMKTPISYYGGKQSMLKHILPIIPKHKVYVEPFFGGGAVFWAKSPSEVEVINDYNSSVSNFYQQLKLNFPGLKKLIDATPYSREVYRTALSIYETPHAFEAPQRAWAFWVCTIQGFSNKIGSWRASSITSKESRLNESKKTGFDPNLSKRLTHVQIENKDALELIKKLDSVDTFFYLDPPYVGTEQGHYGGYTQEHFDALLNQICQLKGKFLLSSYPNAELKNYIKKFKWFSEIKNMQLSASQDKSRRKQEILTANYPISKTKTDSTVNGIASHKAPNLKVLEEESRLLLKQLRNYSSKSNRHDQRK